MNVHREVGKHNIMIDGARAVGHLDHKVPVIMMENISCKTGAKIVTRGTILT